jgi:hypothetical protein
MIRMVTSITNLKCGVSSNQKIKRKQETCWARWLDEKTSWSTLSPELRISLHRRRISTGSERSNLSGDWIETDCLRVYGQFQPKSVMSTVQTSESTWEPLDCMGNTWSYLLTRGLEDVGKATCFYQERWSGNDL